MQWPAQSPDPSPMEHLWKYMKDQQLLRLVTKAAWKGIPLERRCRHLIESIKRRVEAVSRNKGEATNCSFQKYIHVHLLQLHTKFYSYSLEGAF